MSDRLRTLNRSTMNRRFVVVGESLVDIVIPRDGEPIHAVGGSPMNVAVGVARLDVPTLLITQIGDDEHGRRVSEHVRASGVELAPSAVRPGLRTSTATARLDAGNAAYEFDLTWSLRRHRLPSDASGLHVGSLGATLPPGRDSVLDLVRQAADAEVFISFDPNIRPAFVLDPERSWQDLVDVAASCPLVKVSDEDLRALRPGGPLADLAAELLAGRATDLVVVTHGADGASAHARYFSTHVRTPPVDLVDTVGAGDSFMAAMLAILVDWRVIGAAPDAVRTLDEARVRILLAGAVAAAAVTCSRRGANPPTRRELPPTWPDS